MAKHSKLGRGGSCGFCKLQKVPLEGMNSGGIAGTSTPFGRIKAGPLGGSTLCPKRSPAAKTKPMAERAARCLMNLLGKRFDAHLVEVILAVPALIFIIIFSRCEARAHGTEGARTQRTRA